MLRHANPRTWEGHEVHEASNSFAAVTPGSLQSVLRALGRAAEDPDVSPDDASPVFPDGEEGDDLPVPEGASASAGTDDSLDGKWAASAVEGDCVGGNFAFSSHDGSPNSRDSPAAFHAFADDGVGTDCAFHARLMRLRVPDDPHLQPPVEESDDSPDSPSARL